MIKVYKRRLKIKLRNHQMHMYMCESNGSRHNCIPIFILNLCSYHCSIKKKKLLIYLYDRNRNRITLWKQFVTLYSSSQSSILSIYNIWFLSSNLVVLCIGCHFISGEVPKYSLRANKDV